MFTTCRALLLRANYGGTFSDVGTLRRVATLWLIRFGEEGDAWGAAVDKAKAESEVPVTALTVCHLLVPYIL